MVAKTIDLFTLDDFNLYGKTILVRLDINSPINPSTHAILDNSRFKAHMDTIKELSESKVVILAHQSRPGKNDFISLANHAKMLTHILDKQVMYSDGLFDSRVLKKIRQMKNGDILLLENTRFYSEEVALKKSSLEDLSKTHIVKKLSSVADYYINDAFAAAHRSQATLTGFATRIPCIAGRLMEKEVRMLSKFLTTEEKPRLAIFGGTKVDDSILVSEHLLKSDMVDKILVGGVVANIFLMAKGYDIGDENLAFIKKEVENYDELIEIIKTLLQNYSEKILLPEDVSLNNENKRDEISVEELPNENSIYDIGMQTIQKYTDEIKKAKSIIVNGPMGVFEIPSFAIGTIEIMNAISESDAFTVVGGGHTIVMVNKLGIANKMDHISTGGGALISFITGKEMPAISALKLSKKT